MQYDINLRGLVISRYGSVTNFGNHIGWSTRKACDIVSGRRMPSAKDIETISDALDIHDSETFCHIFFNSMSTKWHL